MGTVNIRITVMETRMLEKDVEISESEYNALLGNGDEPSKVLEEMYADVYDSKYASTEYDYQVFNRDTDKLVVPFN